MTSQRPQQVQVLIVDDDAANLVTLAALFEDEGFSVVTAESLRAASEELARLPEVRVVVTDLNLADGTGVDVARAAEGHAKSPSVVAITGATDVAQHVRHFHAVVKKGTSFGELLERVRDALARRAD